MNAVDYSAPAMERRVAPDATQPRPRRRRPASAWVLMLLAGVIAALTAYAAVRNDSAFYLAATAARELPAGATLTDEAITFTELRVAEEVAATVALREQVAELDGSVLATTVPAGALISHDALRSPSAPSQLRAMSVPLPADRAVAGSIGRGDRVDVIEVAGDAAAYVAVDVEVLGVGRPDSGPVEARRAAPTSSRSPWTTQPRWCSPVRSRAARCRWCAPPDRPRRRWARRSSRASTACRSLDCPTTPQPATARPATPRSGSRQRQRA